MRRRPAWPLALLLTLPLLLAGGCGDSKPREGTTSQPPATSPAATSPAAGESSATASAVPPLRAEAREMSPEALQRTKEATVFFECIERPKGFEPSTFSLGS